MSGLGVIHSEAQGGNSYASTARGEHERSLYLYKRSTIPGTHSATKTLFPRTATSAASALLRGLNGENSPSDLRRPGGCTV